MRPFCCILGVLVTALSAYVADIAVASAGFAHPQRRAQFLWVDAATRAPATVWYGGVLEPITVTERRVPRPILVTGASDTARCRSTAAPSTHVHVTAASLM